MSAQDDIRGYTAAKAIRSPHEPLWRTAAAHVLPQQYSKWQTGGSPAIGGNAQSTNEAARVAYDTTGRRSLPKYQSVLERLATPQGQVYHMLTPNDDNLAGIYAVKVYFDKLNKLLFKLRYHPKARFTPSSNEMYGQIGVYGNGPMYVGERVRNIRSPEMGFKYVSCALADMFFETDDEGEVTGVYRRMWMNARQMKIKFPNAPLPARISNELEKAVPDEAATFEVFHYVRPRDESEYDENAIDAKRHPWKSTYVSIEGSQYVGEEGGYQNMPYPITRTMTMSGNPYGISPAILALPALGGASVMKKSGLMLANRAAQPTWLAHDDGVLNGPVTFKPNSVNYGGLDRQGREMIKELRGGDYNIAMDALEQEKRDIEDSFFVTLFQILTETPTMTATEVIERSAEKGALLSPVMGRLQSDFLGPTIEREIGLLVEMGLMPEMPPELVEAKGEYSVSYTSALAKSMYHEEVSGFMRTFEMAIGAANATGDAAPLDHFNLDIALPEIADNLAAPTRWMRDEDSVKMLRKAREEQRAADQAVQNASGLGAAATAATKIEEGTV